MNSRTWRPIYTSADYREATRRSDAERKQNNGQGTAVRHLSGAKHERLMREDNRRSPNEAGDKAP